MSVDTLIGAGVESVSDGDEFGVVFFLRFFLPSPLPMCR